MPQHSVEILLVEDNPDDVALTLRAFQKNNIANQVIVAADGQAANAAPAQNPASPRPHPTPFGRAF